ncbi:MAG: phage holin family protein [Candidatus Longimicrobiales bacterium M2_2A_002]
MLFLLRLVATAIALWVSVLIVPGITYAGGALGLVGVAVLFGLVNAFIRPVLKLLTCPLVVLTLGLFVFVLNGLMLWLTSELSMSVGIDFNVDGFWAAIFGAIIVSLTSTALTLLLGATAAEETT